MSATDRIVSRRRFLTTSVISASMVALPLQSAFAARPLREFIPNGSATIDHGMFSALLARFVKRDPARYNRVDYLSFKSSGHGELRQYLSLLEKVDPRALSFDEAHAFWINLYNAKTLDIVLEHYPVPSIKKINLGGGGPFGGGPWSKGLINLHGAAFSLDDIEHRIVRPIFGDAMSHYGLNCASYSCPNLASSAYTGKAIGGMLSEGARDYVNHERGLAISDRRITASKIYSWYADDFGGDAGLKEHWKRFAAPPLAERIDDAGISSYTYDWSLNDI